MSTSCCRAINELKDNVRVTLALAGNPNVGKSTIFNQLTGMNAVTANYPGKTVELNVATTEHDGEEIGLIDLPGAYALGSISDDQWVARRAVLDNHPSAVVLVVDATNLARNLYMLLQFLDLGIPVVVALNLHDQAERRGLRTDAKKLEALLGVPVVPTVATRGRGLDEIMHAALAIVRGSESGGKPPKYGRDIEDAIETVAAAVAYNLGDEPLNLTPRGLAILLIEGDEEFRVQVGELEGGSEVLRLVDLIATDISAQHGEDAPLRIARERHGLAGAIAEQAQALDESKTPLVDRLWHYTTAPQTGLPILLAILGGLFAFLFWVGGFLSTQFTNFWSAFVSPMIGGAIHTIFGDTVIAATLIWGFDAGISAALAVGIPYVLTFYFLLAILEDSGYLNSVAFLTDRVMHKLGLHGRSIIPLVAGAGCNVPAIIGTRVLSSKRERTIAATLITMVPCSARTAVILGAVSLYSGWLPALALFGIVMAVIAGIGIGLNKVMPGGTSGLVMEMFPFRAPSLKSVAKKTWARFHEFVFVATPIVLVGSIVLGGLYETNLIWYLTGPLSPIVEGWLGLPAVAGLALIFAILRKELALQLLIAMAAIQVGAGASNLLTFMSHEQIFVYALVNTLYIPCIATISVLGKELGWKTTAGITAFTITIATLLGGIVMRALPLFG